MYRRKFLGVLPTLSMTPMMLGNKRIKQPLNNRIHPDTVYDQIIVGGGLAGCFAALQTAQKGQQVLLVERNSFLGREITAKQRVWLDKEGFDDFSPFLKTLFLPDSEEPEIRVDMGSSWFSDEIPLFNGSIKKQLLLTLLDAGIHVLFMSDLCGLITDRDNNIVHGVLIANKFGLYIARCRTVIDATENLSLARNWNNSFINDHDVNGFVLEYFGISDSVNPELAVPESLGILDNQIQLHKGKRRPDQYFIEFHFKQNSNENPEQQTRKKVVELSSWLLKNHSAFSKARLFQMALETFFIQKNSCSIESGFSNLSVLSPVNKENLSCKDILDIQNRIKDSGQNISLPISVSDDQLYIQHSQGKIPLKACQLSVPDDLNLDFHLMQVQCPYEKYLPVLDSTDIVIAGGGTSGAMAAIGATQEGAHVIVTDQFNDPGGTRTNSRVAGYYYGNQTPWFENHEQDIQLFANRVNNGHKNIPIRMLYLRQKIETKRSKFWGQTITCGSCKQGNRVTGVVISKNGVLGRIKSDWVIDATGDGDVAVFSGAKFKIGDNRMGKTQNYSQWGVNSGIRTFPHVNTYRDYDVLDNSRLSDYMRGLYLTHDQAHHYDFAPLPGIRESRRIIGQYTIDLLDVLENRRYPDTICITYSDFDPHSFGSSEFSRIGYLLPHRIKREVEIPFRAIVPRDLEGLLLSGKAFSQTHNALQFTRMSIDLKQLGYATGMIAAHLVATAAEPKTIHLFSLQKKWLDMKLLPNKILDYEKGESKKAQWLLKDRLTRIRWGEPGAFQQIIRMPGHRVVKKLQEFYEQVKQSSNRDPGKLPLARTLAWFGQPQGVQSIIDELEHLRAQEKTAGPYKREEYEPQSLYWQINQLILLLGFTHDEKAFELIAQIAQETDSGGPPPERDNAYYNDRIDLRIIPHYNRILNLCVIIERHPELRYIPPLKKWLEDPQIGNSVSHTFKQARWRFYPGYLELRIAAALARCGDRTGLDILANYLDDVHHVFTQFAWQELVDITRQQESPDFEIWKTRISKLPARISMQPYKSDGFEL